MYKDLESYGVVKKILLEAIPQIEALKFRAEDNVLIVVSREQELFFLNEAAKDFLLLCDGRRLKEIIDALSEIYDVEKNQLADDLMDLIRDMQYKRVLRMEAT